MSSTGAPWTDEETQFFIDLRNQGWSYSKMLTHPKCRRKSVNSINNRMRHVGVTKTQPVRKGRKLTHSPEVREKILELRKSGMTHKKIGKQMDLTEGQVRGILLRMGWQELRHGERRTKVDEITYETPTHPLKFTDEQLARVGVIRKGESK